MRFFTPQERFTMLFLVLLFVLGTSLYLYKLNHPSFAPAYTINYFDQKMSAARQPTEPTDYNLPLPTKSTVEGFKRKPRPSQPVNINTAGEAKLMTLPGVGPVYAKRIIAFREEKGPFQSVEEIKRIKGIGEKTFLKMKPHISVK
jgi:competence ComEA-like helix-hairpin-helix protein